MQQLKATSAAASGVGAASAPAAAGRDPWGSSLAARARCMHAARRATGTSSSSTRSSSHVVGVWTRPTPDRDETWTRPSYVPTPGQSPVIQPSRREDQPLYAPSAPEFRPAELPEQQKEMPKGPDMPERRPDPIPAGTPKEKPPAGEPQTEAPPESPKEK